jgi:hypothetical protein
MLILGSLRHPVRPEYVFGDLKGEDSGIVGDTIPIMLANLACRANAIVEELTRGGSKEMLREEALLLWQYHVQAVRLIRCGKYGGRPAPVVDGGKVDVAVVAGAKCNWVVAAAVEEARKVRIEAMMKSRFPRVGDECVACTGVATLEWRVKDEATIVDVTADGKRIRFVFGADPSVPRPSVEYNVSDYGLYWQYAGDDLL